MADQPHDDSQNHISGQAACTKPDQPRHHLEIRFVFFMPVQPSFP